MHVSLKKIMDQQVVSRKLPANFQDEDRRLFEHEFKKNNPDCFLVELQNCSFTHSGYLENKGLLYDLRPGSFSEQELHPLPSSLKSRVKVWLKERVLKKKKTFSEASILILPDPWSFEFFHWMTDTLHRLISLPEKPKHYQLVLPDNHRRDYILESLKRIGVPLENLHFFSVNEHAFLPHCQSISLTANTGNPRPETAHKLRNLLRTPEQSYSSASRNIYVSRSKAERRKVTNEQELFPLLKKFNFEIIHMEDLSFSEQADLMTQTNRLISIHGAALSHLSFMPSGAKVLELRKEDDAHNHAFYALADALNIDYYYLKCAFSNFQPGKAGNYFDLSVDLQKFEALLSQMTLSNNNSNSELTNHI